MRFRGGGVGHTSTRAATKVFKADRDILDMKSRHQEQPEGASPETDFNNEEMDNSESDIVAEDLEAEIEEDLEGELSESEVMDYGLWIRAGK